MPFQKGIVTNPNGRPKNSQNRSTDEIRKLVIAFIDKNIGALQADYEALEPAKKLDFIEKLLKHVLPRPLNEFERLTDEEIWKLNNTITGITFNKED